jgi:hypothetical protein
MRQPAAVAADSNVCADGVWEKRDGAGAERTAENERPMPVFM